MRFLSPALVPFLVLVGALLTSPAGGEESPYVGLEGREIKALSGEEVEGLLAGEGMGLALAAELNGYPGPKHVLELAAELELSAEQRAGVEAAWEAMHEEAVRLGGMVLDAERRLDELFAAGTATSEELRATLEELAELGAALRHAHLAAHLETRSLLSDEQVAAYVRLRGYHHGGGPRHHQGRHHAAPAGNGTD